VNLFVVLLVLVSCVLHAGWNLRVKQWNATPAFFFLATGFVALVAAPFFFWTGGIRVLNSATPPVLWVCLLLTGLCQAAYYSFLARAYQAGDASVVYPLARTAPLFVVPLAGLAQHTWPSIVALAGILLAVAGCFVLPRNSLDVRAEPFNSKAFFGPASRWALATAAASAGYTVADAVGVAALRNALPGVRGAFVYGYLEAWTTGLWMTVGLLGTASGRSAVRHSWQAERGRAFALGGLIFATYLLILWAYALTDRTAHVAALRQFSVVLGVLGGIRFLREARTAGRVAGAGLIVAGLLLITLGR
jgi:uncharacterized membrane protein